jgi:hypothetical protein
MDMFTQLGEFHIEDVGGSGDAIAGFPQKHVTGNQLEQHGDPLLGLFGKNPLYHKMDAPFHVHFCKLEPASLADRLQDLSALGVAMQGKP